MWMKITRAAEMLGVAPDSVRRRAQRDGWPMRGRGMGREVDVPDDSLVSELVTESEPPPVVEDDPISGMVDRGAYVWDADRDVYIVHLPSHSAPFVRSGEWIRALWRKYTSGAQINETCREFAIDRQSFIELKRALGLTKTSAPWTDEEVETGEDDDLVGDALERRKRELLTRVERTEWMQIKRDAEAYRADLEWVREEIRRVEWYADPLPLVESDPGEHVTLVGASDWHVGKRAHGKDHTLKEQVDELHDYARAVAGAALDLGTPERFIVPVGSDLVHVDTMSQTTTRGTPQGAQSVGTTRGACAGAISIMAVLIDALAPHAPVEVRWVPGNHDRLVSYLIALALAERYRHSDYVDVHHEETPRQYVRIGDASLMLTHGDGERASDLPMIMAREMPGRDLAKSVIAHGHKHRTERDEQDHSGVQRVCLRSPARPDDWHVRRGYVGPVPGTTLLVIDPDFGLRGTWYA